MKKVLVIAPYAYLPFHSGGQKFIAQFLQHLGQRTDLTVIAVAENDLSLATNYKIIPLLKRSFARYYDASLTKKITAIVKEQGFDTVIWEHPYYAWLAFRVRKRTGVRTILHTHNIEYQRFKSTGRWWWPVLKWYEKKAFRKADGLFFISPEDKQFAIDQWKIDRSKCFDLPFGIDIREYPSDRAASREAISRRHGISQDEKILLFTGVLSYKPNLDALRIILDTINPSLLASGLKYRIIICGKGLPDGMNKLEAYKDQHIIFAGFVEDIASYYKSADIFLNPVLSGGGVKTKMVEAIAYGATVVSTETGAMGIDRKICAEKLVIAVDTDWTGFKNLVIAETNKALPTPDRFYQQYYWPLLIEKTLTEAL